MSVRQLPQLVSTGRTAATLEVLKLKVLQVFPGITILEVGPGAEPGTLRFRVEQVSDQRAFLLSFYPLVLTDPNAATRMEAAGYRVQALQAAQRPHLARILHFAQVENYAMVITDWQDGQSLESILRSNRTFDLDTALKMIHDLSEGLNSLHLFGLVHGAIRPGCIWVTSKGEVVLGGFGLGEILSGQRSRDLADTVYDAPEIRYSALQPDDPRCDVFSLGVVSYQILTGNLPTGQFIERPSKRHDTGAWLDQLVLKAMNHDAGQRHQTALGFQHAMQGRVLSAVDLPPEPVEEAPRRREYSPIAQAAGEFSRFWWIFGGAMLLVVLACLFFGGMIPLGQDKNKYSEIEGARMMKEVASLLLEKKAAEAAAVMAKLAKMKAEAKAVALEKVMNELLGQGKYDEALLLAEQMIQAEGDPQDEKTRKIAQANSSKIKDFLSMMREAEKARKEENFSVEKRTLEKAIALMPTDVNARWKLSLNPLVFEIKYRLAVAELARNNPRQKEWHISYQPERDGMEIDVSDHAALVDISALANLPITELDMSWTAVSDLRKFATSDLVALHMDYAPVEDLYYLRDLKLKNLSFDGTPVTDLTVLGKLPTLQSVRGRPGEAAFFRFPVPLPASKWENSLGQRFRPADQPRTLVCVWETRQFDYAVFLGEKFSKARDSRLQPLRAKPLLPAHQLTLEEAAEFCQWLTQRETRLGMLTRGMFYRLPTLNEKKGLAQWLQAHQPLAEIKSSLIAPESALLLLEEPDRPKGVKPDLPAQDPAKEMVVTNVAREGPVRGFFDVETNAAEWWTNDAELFLPEMLGKLRVKNTLAQITASKAKTEPKSKGEPVALSGFRLVLDLGPVEEEAPSRPSKSAK